jgi:hypothetical protein
MNPMRTILNEMRLTIVGAVLGIALILTALADIDLVKLDLKLLDGIEKHQVDDVLVGLTLIFVGLVIDRVLSRRRKQKYHQAEIEAQRLRTLKATMRTVQDIVNNFLNSLLLFEIPAKDVISRGSLDTIEELIQDTYQKLKALGDLESVREIPIATGVGIEYAQSCPTVAAPARTTERVSRPLLQRIFRALQRFCRDSLISGLVLLGSLRVPFAVDSSKFAKRLLIA